MGTDPVWVEDTRPASRPATAVGASPISREQVVLWLGGAEQVTCTLRPQTTPFHVSQPIAVALALPVSAVVSAGLAWLAWQARLLPWTDVATRLALLLALLALAAPIIILSACSDIGAVDVATAAAAKTMLVAANGTSAWFRADDQHATLLWSELADVTQGWDFVHFHRTDGTEVRVAKVAGYEHVIRAAKLIVAQRREADEALLDRMEHGLSPAEDGADADRGLSVSP